MPGYSLLSLSCKKSTHIEDRLVSHVIHSPGNLRLPTYSLPQNSVGQRLDSQKLPIHITMSFYELPSLRDVHEASSLIERKIKKTPVGTSLHLSHIVSSSLRQARGNPSSQSSIELFFKLETLQITGSFKFHGASHFLATLEDHELSNGVVAYSTGTSTV
jgi:hypothetical protein